MNKKPAGIIILSTLLILGSLYKVLGLLNYDYYQFMFQQLPDDIIIKRYVGSIFLRAIFIWCAIGVLMNRDLARRVLIVTSLLNLCLVTIKHPADVFTNIAIYKEVQDGHNHFPEGTTVQNTLYPVYPKFCSAMKVPTVGPCQDIKGYSGPISDYPLKFPQIPQISRVTFIVIDVVFSFILIFYFTRPAIRRYFRHES